MTHDLDPAGRAARAAELLDLWRMFDPLALGPAAEPDVYDRHVEPLLRVLEAEGDEQELATEIRIVMADFMGIAWSSTREAEAEVFATRVMAWWRSNWSQSRG